ncbi:uncharacterized protein LOC109535870 isoform X1 [Dendroctonus ponderosae]|uniref:Uncharacterized protein n=2 Tax=Dendroctonus ponderosae TaxID=77166 RepID=A0AAR5P8M6_DENPD|nr:uncharacterized protein LOC109535870 isoform X1 [Dendroctonus ponderosae]
MASAGTQQPAIGSSQPTDQKGIPKSKRKLQKHLRSAGLAYVSRTGKLIPAKKVSDELCQCPHKCDELVSSEARQRLFQHFYGLGEADLQNNFLRQNMDLRARLNIPETTGSGRPPRRITCKYLVPLLDESLAEDDFLYFESKVQATIYSISDYMNILQNRAVEVCQKAFVSAFVITTKRVRLQREKLIASLGLNSYRSHNRSKKEKDDKSQLFTTLETNNNNNSLVLNNNTITLNSIKSKFNLPSNLSLSTCQVSGSNSTQDQPESISAKRLACILGKKSQEELRELNITLERSTSSSDSEDDETAVKPSPPKKFKKQRNSNLLKLDNPLLPFGLVIPDGVTIAPVMGPDHDRDIAIVNNFFHNQLWKPEYIGAYS